LNLMRLNSNFLQIDILDQFIVGLIQNINVETIMADDLNITENKAGSKNLISQEKTSEVVSELYNLGLREAREQFEKNYFKFHIKSKISMTDLAKKSGVERTHLYRKLKQLKINTK
jgi:two-component system nitrogen regulation response regulator NtrX